ncbi:uncharacterized protein LOC132308514 [Cornus florida]|uniref:uncharacterized protein LOC132308514 n=1 Tax=Cornus florida TaxID=4283 RepID=UPI00289C0ED8|nr:uncharacterized protein LOC132308514 [Cornus florida]
MAQRKTKPHFSAGENGEDRGGVTQRKSIEPVDHWAFLDEIEAPTWVDLTFEANSTYQDNGDDWFHTSHLFHQRSSRQLISAFSHSGEGSNYLDFGLQGPSSPKLPSSVSKSRGKHYRSREWGRSNCALISIKQHPVKSLISKSSPGKEIKFKSNYRKPKGNAGSEASVVCQSSLTETAGSNYSKPIYSFADSKISSGCIKEGNSNSTSTITCNNSAQEQQKVLEVSSGTFGHTSGLLSAALRITLRKSCFTGQALRMETIGERQSQGRKSSSGKSSVGSSSNPRYDVKNTAVNTRHNKDKTPDSRNVLRMSQATENKVKVSNASKTSNAQVQDMSSKSGAGDKIIAVRTIRQETAKSKVQYQTVNAKAMVQDRVIRGSLTAAIKAKDTVGVGRYNKLACGGKENKIGRMSVGQKLSTRDNAVGGMVQGQKVTKPSVPQKSDGTGLIGPKGKICGRSAVKTSTNASQKVHFR